MPVSLALTGCYRASELWVRLDDAFMTCTELGVTVQKFSFLMRFIFPCRKINKMCVKKKRSNEAIQSFVGHFVGLCANSLWLLVTK